MAFWITGARGRTSQKGKLDQIYGLNYKEICINRCHNALRKLYGCVTSTFTHLA